MDIETVRDFFSAFGPIDIRRMFGGMGLYADGVLFGVVAFDAVHLRADETTIPDFTAEHCAPFGYTTKQGPRESRWLWKIPERLYDDPDELALWARKALRAAQRLAAAKDAVKTERAARGAQKKTAAKKTAVKKKSTPKKPAPKKAAPKKPTATAARAKSGATKAAAKSGRVRRPASRKPAKAPGRSRK